MKCGIYGFVHQIYKHSLQTPGISCNRVKNFNKMTTLDPIKRQICGKCHYPQRTCLCPWIDPIATPLNIIVLQHPKEGKHAKNTVKLLSLGLIEMSVLQGETPEDWPELVNNVTKNPQRYSLIYPHQLSVPIESIHTEAQKAQCFPANHNVIFIDSSWRKALKIWHLNPWLQLCSSWHFSEPPKNHYHIRHTTQRNSLSTLESVAYVLEYTHKVDCTSLRTLLVHMQNQSFLENRKHRV